MTATRPDKAFDEGHQLASDLSVPSAISIAREASSSALGITCEYRSIVTLSVECPSISITTRGETPWAMSKDAHVSVNLDTLVEAGMEAHVEVFATDSEFETATSYLDAYLRADADKVPVLKLHGTIQDFDSCIVSDETTRLGIMGGKLDVLRRISEGDVKRDWAYVGASMRDFDLREFFRDHQFADHVNETWVAPYLVPTVREYEELRLAHWRVQDSRASMQDHLVTETADAFFAAMLAARQV